MDVLYTYPNHDDQFIGVVLPDNVSDLAIVLPMFSRVEDWELFKTESALSLDVGSVFTFIKTEPKNIDEEVSNLFTMPTTEF